MSMQEENERATPQDIGQTLLVLAYEFDDKPSVERLRKLPNIAELTDISKELAAKARVIVEEVNQACQQYDSIDLQFFTGDNNWHSDVGLTLFPVFTFFDSCYVRLEKNILGLVGQKINLAVFSLGFGKDKHQKIEEYIDIFYQEFAHQTDGIEREAADRFVWHYTEFLEQVDALLGNCTFLFQAQKQLIFSLRYAIRSLFIADGEGWQDAAMTTMGKVIGQMAPICLPDKTRMMSKIKKMGRRHLPTTLSTLFEQERLVFQEQLHKLFLEKYQKVVDEMTIAWQNYGHALHFLNQQIENVLQYSNQSIAEIKEG
jgi:hypothetical protein